MSIVSHKSPKGCQEHRQGWNEMEPLQTATHPYQPRRVAREQRFDWMSKRPSDRGRTLLPRTDNRGKEWCSVTPSGLIFIAPNSRGFTPACSLNALSGL